MRKYISSSRVLYFTSLLLLLYMPLHVLLSRWLSTFTGGLMIWETGKDFLTLFGSLVACSILLGHRSKLRRSRKLLLLLSLISLYALLHFSFIAKQDMDRHAFVMGVLYNLRIFAYLIMGLALAAVMDDKQYRRIAQLLVGISSFVAIFAVIQYFSPKDLMIHFGYSIERGAKPNFFIDDKPDLPRVMSTIREPNSLGAFLIIPILTLLRYLLKFKNVRKTSSTIAIVTLVHIMALVWTFSRSSFIGLGLSIVSFCILSYTRKSLDFIKKRLPAIVALLIVLAGTLFIFRNAYVVQNVVLHADQKTVQTDPNQKRLNMQSQAVRDIYKHPWGHAPGTSGPIAFENKKGGLITENYYLQVGYEVGVLGMLIFCGIFLILIDIIYSSRKSWWRSTILASMVGYAFIGLLTHIWTNEAVAYQWWLLAGICVGDATFKEGR